MNGSCENTVLWRGHFNATGFETSVNLTVYGGTCKRVLCIYFCYLFQD